MSTLEAILLFFVSGTQKVISEFLVTEERLSTSKFFNTLTSLLHFPPLTGKTQNRIMCNVQITDVKM